MAYYLLSPQISNLINTQTLHCRLCANLKTHSQLLNLQLSETMLKDTEHKLAQLHLAVDFRENTLPKTVCLECISSLKYAFDYIQSVKNAQIMLKLFLPASVVAKNEPEIDTGNDINKPPCEEYNDGLEIKSDIDPIPISDQILDPSLPDGEVAIKPLEDCKNEIIIDIKPDIAQLSIPTNSQHLDFKLPDDDNTMKPYEEYNNDSIMETKLDSKSEIYNVDEGSNDKLRQPDCDVDVTMEPEMSDLDTKCSKDQNYIESQSEFEIQPTNITAPCSKNDNIGYLNNKCESQFNNSESEVIPTWSEYIWQCGYCQSQFTTIKELQTHSKDTHNVCNPYQCTDCKRKLSNFAVFLKHVRIHRKHLKRSCHECFKIFPHMKVTNKHKIDHAISVYQCPGCYQTFTSSEQLEEHKNSYFKMYLTPSPLMKGVTSLTCFICKAVFKNRSGLRNHLINIHTEKKQHHVCQWCGKIFHLKGRLKAHLEIHEKKKFQCDVCKAWFSSRTNIYNHMKTHLDTKPYSCDECGKCFRQKRKLKSHKIIHTDSKPFVCKFCNKSFRQQNTMYIHLRQHTGVKPYSCDICNKDFTNYSNHSKHMKRIHNMIIANQKNIVNEDEKLQNQ